MLLRLVRPMKRQGSSNFQFEQRIPTDLRERLIGMTLEVPRASGRKLITITEKTRAIRFSLGASDSREAKRQQAQAIEYLEGVYHNLRAAAPISLTHKQCVALAGELYRSWAGDLETSTRISFQQEADGSVVRDYSVDLETEAGVLTLEAGRLGDLEGADLERHLGPLANRLLLRRGITELERHSREMLLSEFAKALAEGMTAGSRKAQGDYRADPVAERFPAWEPPVDHSPKRKPLPASGVSLTGLVEAWWTEAKAVGKSESTYESYSNTFRLFSAFLGHDDAARVTPQDVVNYKDHRLSAANPKTKKPVSAKTVKAGDLTALKSVFDWAVTNLKVASNPASGVTIKLGKQMKVRERDFTDQEALAILQAASAALAGKTRPNQTDMARRWVPWLCAYSGSRVGEMVQLRKEDIRKDGEAWIMSVTPEAGTVKGKERRDIPLHPHLVEMGLPEFVERSKGGYLFMTVKPGKTFRGTWQSKKNRLAEFAREVVKDPNVAPNHGWRHTFKTKGFEAGIQEKVLDAICGHAPASVGRAYGTVSMQTKVDAMAAFPRYAAS